MDDKVLFKGLQQISQIFSKAFTDVSDVFAKLADPPWEHDLTYASRRAAEIQKTTLALAVAPTPNPAAVAAVPAAEETPKKKRTRRLPPPPEGFVAPKMAAAELKMSTSNLYNLIKLDVFKGAQRNPQNGWYQIPRKALDEYKVEIGLTVEPPPVAPAPPLPPIEASPPPAPPPLHEKPVAEKLAEDLDILESEIEELASYLTSMNPTHRRAQLCTWAGTVRKLIDQGEPVVTGRGWKVIRRLGEMVSKYKTWVNAVNPSWNFDDWDLYIKVTGALEPLKLPPEEAEAMALGNLQAIALSPKQVPSDIALEVIEGAKNALGKEHPMVANAYRVFLNKLVKASAASDRTAAADFLSEVSEEVLAMTKGKRMLIIGGQGERENYREKYVEAFQLDRCDWVRHDRDREALMADSKVNPRTYDLMLYLSGYSGHGSTHFVQLAKKKNLPVVRVPRGYSVSSLANAIKVQYKPGRITNKHAVAKAAAKIKAMNGHGKAIRRASERRTSA